ASTSGSSSRARRSAAAACTRSGWRAATPPATPTATPDPYPTAARARLAAARPVPGVARKAGKLLRKLVPSSARRDVAPSRTGGGSMATRDSSWPSGTPCWVDLGVDDVSRARAFYSRLFGWDTQAGPPEAGGYTMCMLSGRPVAGIGPKMGPPEVPPFWTVHIPPDDADRTAGHGPPA